MTLSPSVMLRGLAGSSSSTLERSTSHADEVLKKDRSAILFRYVLKEYRMVSPEEISWKQMTRNSDFEHRSSSGGEGRRSARGEDDWWMFIRQTIRRKVIRKYLFFEGERVLQQLKQSTSNPMFTCYRWIFSPCELKELFSFH